MLQKILCKWSNRTCCTERAIIEITTLTILKALWLRDDAPEVLMVYTELIYSFVTLKLNYDFYVFNFWLFSAAELLSPLYSNNFNSQSLRYN